MTLRIGVTGGIGSGKSTVAKLLVDYGATCIDTDLIARELTQAGGAAISVIEREFGHAMLDANGALNRAAMRELAFTDEDSAADETTNPRRRLEAILHPLIQAEAERRAERAQSAGACVMVFDVPLLVESGHSGHWRSKVDKILVIDCSEATQIQRVQQRSGWSTDAVRRVIAQQATRDERRAVADAVIFNDALSLDALKHEVEKIWRQWSPPCA